MGRAGSSVRSAISRRGNYVLTGLPSRKMTGLSSTGHLRVISFKVALLAMRILVIEDEPRILGFLARGLEAEGFAVAAARNGSEGLKRARRESYDLVLLDLLLPGLDGLSVLHELNRARPELPVVILSARSDLPTKLRGFGLGAADYLSKPFSFDELIARIRVQLRKAGQGANGPVVRAGWATFACANLVAMVLWPSWEPIPFHFIWISLTLVYGFRVWRATATYLTLGGVVAATGALILQDAFVGEQLWGELFEVPLMSAMFLAMVWHARRRQEALVVVERQAEQRASLLERQERFLHDASHELRTPVTIARGHLEILRRANGHPAPEIDVALDELQRIEQILERLLLLAKADQPDFVVLEDLELDACLEDVFMRWSEVAPRTWRLGELAPGTVSVDLEGLRCALDALLENPVEYTDPGDTIRL